MRLLGAISRLRDRWLIYRAVRQGLKLGQQVRIIGKPHFSSEPYLIEIGDHVTISSRVVFITHDGATWVFRDVPQYEGLQRFGRIVIKDNCFIGEGAIILPGVSIGPNAVVGAGAVVTRSVPADCVVAGAPARYICSYDEFIARSLPRCVYYPPEIASDPNRLRKVLLETLPPPDAPPIAVPETPEESEPVNADVPSSAA